VRRSVREGVNRKQMTGVVEFRKGMRTGRRVGGVGKRLSVKF